MSWAETKYAINSSIGTDDFKPIDKMLEYEIFPSGVVALNLGSAEITTTKSQKVVRLGIGGKCRVSFTVVGTYSMSGSIKVLKNSIEVLSILNPAINSKKDYTTDIFSVEKNDLIVVEYESTREADRFDINDVCVLGSVLPNGTFKEVI